MGFGHPNSWDVSSQHLKTTALLTCKDNALSRGSQPFACKIHTAFYFCNLLAGYLQRGVGHHFFDLLGILPDKSRLLNENDDFYTQNLLFELLSSGSSGRFFCYFCCCMRLGSSEPATVIDDDWLMNYPLELSNSTSNQLYITLQNSHPGRTLDRKQALKPERTVVQNQFAGNGETSPRFFSWILGWFLSNWNSASSRGPGGFALGHSRLGGYRLNLWCCLQVLMLQFLN